MDAFPVKIPLSSAFFCITLLKIKFQKEIFIVMPQKNHFRFPKEPFNEQFLKEPFFSVKNILKKTNYAPFYNM